MSVNQGSVNIIESTPSDIVKESLILLIICKYCNYAAGSININIGKAYIVKKDYNVKILNGVALDEQQEMNIWQSSSKVNKPTFLQFIDNMSYNVHTVIE